jgi:hypothetical protein
MSTSTKQRTVRVSERTHKYLHEVSELTGKPMTAVLDHAVERYRREQILKEANRAWAAMMEDPGTRAEIEAEHKILEGTLLDGLEDEPW